MSKMKASKRQKYAGALSIPVMSTPAKHLPGMVPRPGSDWPPRLAQLGHAVADRLEAEEKERRRKTLLVVMEKMALLFAHYGINPKKPGSRRDLALTLIRTHEPDRLSGRTIHISDVYDREQIDPEADDADFILAFHLAHRHVPGFQHENVGEPAVRLLDPADMACLWLAATLIKRKLIQDGRDPSHRLVARVLTNRDELKQFLPSVDAWQGVARIIENRGNNRRDRPRRISANTIRQHYLPWMDDAWRAYLDDEANDFQIVLIEQAWPLIPEEWKFLPDLDLGYSEVQKRLEKFL